MKLSTRLARPAHLDGFNIAGAIASVAVAVALYTRFGINGALSRDEAIYTYAGQQLAQGVPPYASIFDPKTPLASMIAGAAAALANALGRNNIYAIRAAFFVCACLATLAVYALAVQLFRSSVAGVVAAVVFSSFTGFAEDALSGPDAKTPGILLAVVSMLLAARHRWFLAALAGSLAFLVWQPLAVYALVAALAAVLNSPRERWKSLGLAVLGGAVPLVLVTLYFAAVGALGKFYQAAILFPVTGVYRGRETVGARITVITQAVHQYYKFSGALLWIGLAALIVLAVARLLSKRASVRQALRDPLICVALLSAVAEAVYARSDFQSYPDVYPFLPYAAMGLAGAAAGVIRFLRAPAARLAGVTAALTALAVLTAFSWSWFGNAPFHDRFRSQRADACALARTVGPRGHLYVLGNPVLLAMTHRRNPDRFIYLGSGIDRWKVKRSPGGFNGWAEQIMATRPSVIAQGGWHTDLSMRMNEWLKSAGYTPRFAGEWYLLLTPEARARARSHGVRLTTKPTPYATGIAGHELPKTGCGAASQSRARSL